MGELDFSPCIFGWPWGGQGYFRGPQNKNLETHFQQSTSTFMLNKNQSAQRKPMQARGNHANSTLESRSRNQTLHLHSRANVLIG